MSMFGNLTTNDLEESQDYLGGFSPLETDIYSGIIKMAYAGEAKSGAKSITLLVDFSGKEYRDTVYITTKDGNNFFFKKDKDGKPTKTKVALPSFTVIDDICLITTDKPLAEQDVEEKVVKVWDAEAKKELPKNVPVLVDLIGKNISLGILKQLENKSEKDSNDKYVPIADTRESNTIDKVFHTESQMTVAEARNGVQEATFWGSWMERNKGKTRDRRTIKEDGAGVSGRPGRSAGMPPQASQAKAQTKSLFGGR